MPRESKADKKKRVAKITRRLKKLDPDARTALDWSNPLELLVATILSAQCTDKKVNEVTPELFKRYKTAADWASADPNELEQALRPTGFFRNKARSIRRACAKIAEEHGGRVPDTMDELVELPGVARKTANVVLGDAFDKREGIVVDTHVTRVSRRLKLTSRKSNQGDKIEKDLMDLVPRKDWTAFAHLLIHHGRSTCTARKPDCGQCAIAGLCPSAGKV